MHPRHARVVTVTTPMEAPGIHRSRCPPVTGERPRSVIADGRLDPDDRRGYFSIDRTSKLAGGRKAPPVGCPARWPGRLGRSPSGRSMPISTTTPSLPSRQAQARKASPRISTIRWDHDQLRRAADDGSSTFGFYGWPILAIHLLAQTLRSVAAPVGPLRPAVQGRPEPAAAAGRSVPRVQQEARWPEIRAFEPEARKVSAGDGSRRGSANWRKLRPRARIEMRIRAESVFKMPALPRSKNRLIYSSGSTGFASGG